MESKKLTFDQVFSIWMKAEQNQVDGPKYLPVAKARGFNSVTGWRRATATRLGMQNKQWHLEEIKNPEEVIANIIVGPYPGWSLFLKNKLHTTFKKAIELPKFFEWCKSHDRIPFIAEQFPLPTTLILFRRPNGELIHIEGGHRACAFVYAQKIGKPINLKQSKEKDKLGNLKSNKIFAAIADIDENDEKVMLELLEKGTGKQNIS